VSSDRVGKVLTIRRDGRAELQDECANEGTRDFGSVWLKLVQVEREGCPEETRVGGPKETLLRASC
jgi:hypothetical protein